MNHMTPPIDAVAFQKFVVDGGYVMPALLLTGFVLWYCLIMRCFLLRRRISVSLGDYVQSANSACRGVFADIIATFKSAPPQANLYPFELAVLATTHRIKQYRRVIASLCVIAPLLGLLGTVSGMIETFASLVTMALFAQSGGVGGGISEALISTQMGLIIAVPGIVAGRLLQRKEDRIINEMHQLNQSVKQACTEGAAP
jgi:biopolymer transport protein ExbB